MISAVIPTHNEEKYLADCLESLKNQTVKIDEIIIADWNSTDRTKSIAEHYGATFISLRKRGIGYGRNKGAERAKGNIILHLSADAVYEKDFVKNIVMPIKTGEADVVVGAIFVRNANIIERIGELLLNYVAVPLAYIFGFVFASGDAIAITKSLYTKVGGISESLNTGEDTDLVIKAKRSGARVKFALSARVFTNPRRIRKWGYVRYFTFHLKNFFSMNLKGKAEKHYEPVR